MERPLLIIRADALPGIGTGHVMRCLALAQEWMRRGGRALVAGGVDSPSLAERLRDEGVDFRPLAVEPGSGDDVAALSALASESGAAWVCVDSYAFDGEAYGALSRSLSACGTRLMVMDDMAEQENYPVDMVLNQNIETGDVAYPGAVLALRGTAYSLLRDEFLNHHPRAREIGDRALRLLVCFGGEDPEGMTARSVEALGTCRTGLDVRVVLGPANRFRVAARDTSGDAAAKSTAYQCEILSDVRDMAEQMLWADAALAGAGSMCWEMAFLGLPCLLVETAPNQRALAKGMDRAGAAINLGTSADLEAPALAPVLSGAVDRLAREPGLLRDMSAKAAVLVDGHGRGRVVERMWPTRLGLRPAADDDCRLIFGWANDPGARRWSFNPEPIAYADHEAWYARLLADPDRELFVAENQCGVPVGQVRFEADGGQDVISVSLDRGFRGLGLGAALIAAGCAARTGAAKARPVRALVKPDNAASARAFAKAGFRARPELAAPNAETMIFDPREDA